MEIWADPISTSWICVDMWELSVVSQWTEIKIKLLYKACKGLHGPPSAYISSLSLYLPAHRSSAGFPKMRPWKKGHEFIWKGNNKGMGNRHSQGEEANKRCLIKRVTMMGSWDSVPMRTPGRWQGAQNKNMPHPSQGMGKQGHVSTNSLIIGWEQLLGHQLSGTCSLPNMLTQEKLPL